MTTKPLPRIGVDRAFYCPITTDDSAEIVYGTPVELLGVSQVRYNPNTQMAVFYADDGAYESVSQDGETDLLLNAADLDPDDYAFLMGLTQSATTGVIDEDTDDNPPTVAFGYRTQKSDGSYRYIWILKGKFGKPSLDALTKSNSINMQEREIPFKGLNRDYDGKKRRRVDSDDALLPTGLTNAALNSSVTGWFSDPDYAPVAPGTALSDVVAVVSEETNGGIDLTFTAAAAATGITAQVYDAVYGTWKTVSTLATITAASTTATITGLTEGNTYTCRLIVVGGGSNGITNTDSAPAKAA